MKYKGWDLLVLVDVPHYYEIKDVHSPYNVVKFGPEVETNFSKNPKRYSGTRRFYAWKEGEESILNYSFEGIKKNIDKIEDK